MNKEVLISTHTKQKFNTKNGLIDVQDISNGKKELICDIADKLEQFVTHRQEYPTDETSLVSFDLDVVVVSRSRYDELVKMESKYLAFNN